MLVNIGWIWISVPSGHGWGLVWPRWSQKIHLWLLILCWLPSRLTLKIGQYNFTPAWWLVVSLVHLWIFNNRCCWECLGEAYLSRGSFSSALKAFTRALEVISPYIYDLNSELFSVPSILSWILPQLSPPTSELLFMYLQNQAHIFSIPVHFIHYAYSGMLWVCSSNFYFPELGISGNVLANMRRHLQTMNPFFLETQATCLPWKVY